MAARILAVDDSALILKLISQSLSRGGFQVFTASSGAEALKQIEAVKPDALILDVMMPGTDGYTICRQIRRNPSSASLPVLMLTAQSTLEDKIKGYEAGADDYLTKPFEPSELQARLAALLRRTASPANGPGVTSGSSKTIAVFSLRGGTGVSSVAANLAAGLAQLWTRPTVLVDLALTSGHGALMLNLSPRATWAEIASRAPAEIDAEMLEQILSVHPGGARVLAAPRRPEQGEALSAEHVKTVLDVLGQRYEYVILDLPHDLRDVTVAGLDRADDILLLFTPELASVMSADVALETFESLSYPKERVRLVLNHLYERSYLNVSEMESVLKRKVNVVLPFVPGIMVPALNNGVPAVLDKPDTEMGALLEDLAFYVSKDVDRSERPASPSKSWLRVSNRMERKKK